MTTPCSFQDFTRTCSYVFGPVLVEYNGEKTISDFVKCSSFIISLYMTHYWAQATSQKECSGIVLRRPGAVWELIAFAVLRKFLHDVCLHRELVVNFKCIFTYKTQISKNQRCEPDLNLQPVAAWETYYIYCGAGLAKIPKTGLNNKNLKHKVQHKASSWHKV